MPDRSEKMICLGVLTRPHGIKGEFCLNLYADSPTLLSGPITLKKPDGTEKPCTAEGFRPHKNAWLVTIRGVNDRTQAEALAGSTLWLPRHCLPALNENEAYITDLLGRPVALTDGTVLGTFDHIETPGGQMLWAIRSAELLTNSVFDENGDAVNMYCMSLEDIEPQVPVLREQAAAALYNALCTTGVLKY